MTITSIEDVIEQPGREHRYLSAEALLATEWNSSRFSKEDKEWMTAEVRGGLPLRAKRKAFAHVRAALLEQKTPRTSAAIDARIQALNAVQPLLELKVVLADFITAVELRHVPGNGVSPLALTEAFLAYYGSKGLDLMNGQYLDGLGHPTQEISDLAMHLVEVPRDERTGDWLPVFPGKVAEFRYFWENGQREISRLDHKGDVEWDDFANPAGTMRVEADSARRIDQRNVARSIEAVKMNLTAAFDKARLRKAISGYGETALDFDDLHAVLTRHTKREFSRWDMITVAGELYPESLAYPFGEHGPQLVVDTEGVDRMDRFRRDAGITEDPFSDMVNHQIDTTQAYEAYQRWEQEQKLAPLVPENLTGPTCSTLGELGWYMFTSRFGSSEEIYISADAHERYLPEEDEDGDEV